MNRPVPAADATARLQDGALEGSNVSPVETMVAMITAFQDVEAYARRIDNAERAADKITHETITLLHKTFITPFDRDQIHQLITAMDDILDLMQDSAESMHLFDIQSLPPASLVLSANPDSATARPLMWGMSMSSSTMSGISSRILRSASWPSPASATWPSSRGTTRRRPST